MKHHLSLVALISGLGATLAATFVGCTEDKPDALPAAMTPDAGDAGTAPLAEPAVPCADPVDAIYQDPGGGGTYDPQTRGEILKCSKAADLGKDAMQAELARVGYAGKPLTSGARVYKVLYRTQRGDAAGSAGYSSAIVYIPTEQRAEKLPILVGGRGSRGQAARCALSKFDPAIAAQNDDAYRLIYSLVGQGYAMIVPDLAGYAGYGAPKNPPSAYAQATDVGRSVLDGSRALKRLYPQLDDATVLVGHSQGGHSVLAALSMGETYGAQGPIVGVATYAPLWLSQRTWGALLDGGLANARDYKLTGPYADASAVSVWYHYTQAELLDGPGEGLKLFKADKQAAVKQFIEGSCFTEYKPLQDSATFAYELFEDPFWTSVGLAATGLSKCKAGDAVCEKWLGRYSADRPHLTGKAAATPLLVMYGGNDTTIPAERMSCGIDRLKTDGTQLTVCYEPDATHQTIMNVRGDHVSDWIASITLGAPAPAACAANETAIKKSCDTLPPND